MDKIFNKPFAVNGSRVAIPENGSDSERVSFDKGFTQPYEIEAPSVDNPQGQGFNILRPEMNEALYQISLACNTLAENIDKWVALTNENLNNITEKGRYFQTNQNLATSANNYPSEQTGYLLVFDSVNNNVTQFYKVANSNTIYNRYLNNGVWNDWDKITLQSEFLQEINKKRDITDSYSQQETQKVVGDLVQFTTGDVDFVNFYNKSKVSIFATCRVHSMNVDSWVDVRLRCTTTNQVGKVATYYASGGAKDATVCLGATFNAKNYGRLYFALELIYGGGQIAYPNYIGIFHD